MSLSSPTRYFLFVLVALLMTLTLTLTKMTVNANNDDSHISSSPPPPSSSAPSSSSPPSRVRLVISASDVYEASSVGIINENQADQLLLFFATKTQLAHVDDEVYTQVVHEKQSSSLSVDSESESDADADGNVDFVSLVGAASRVFSLSNMFYLICLLFTTISMILLFTLLWSRTQEGIQRASLLTATALLYAAFYIIMGRKLMLSSNSSNNSNNSNNSDSTDSPSQSIANGHVHLIGALMMSLVPIVIVPAAVFAITHVSVLANFRYAERECKQKVEKMKEDVGKVKEQKGKMRDVQTEIIMQAVDVLINSFSYNLVFLSSVTLTTSLVLFVYCPFPLIQIPIFFHSFLLLFVLSSRASFFPRSSIYFFYFSLVYSLFTFTMSVFPSLFPFSLHDSHNVSLGALCASSFTFLYALPVVLIDISIFIQHRQHFSIVNIDLLFINDVESAPAPAAASAVTRVSYDEPLAAFHYNREHFRAGSVVPYRLLTPLSFCLFILFIMIHVALLLVSIALHSWIFVPTSLISLACALFTHSKATLFTTLFDLPLALILLFLSISVSYSGTRDEMLLHALRWVGDEIIIISLLQFFVRFTLAIYAHILLYHTLSSLVTRFSQRPGRFSLSSFPLTLFLYMMFVVVSSCIKFEPSSLLSFASTVHAISLACTILRQTHGDRFFQWASTNSRAVDDDEESDESRSFKLLVLLYMGLRVCLVGISVDGRIIYLFGTGLCALSIAACFARVTILSSSSAVHVWYWLFLGCFLSIMTMLSSALLSSPSLVLMIEGSFGIYAFVALLVHRVTSNKIAAVVAISVCAVVTMMIAFNIVNDDDHVMSSMTMMITKNFASSAMSYAFPKYIREACIDVPEIRAVLELFRTALNDNN